MKYMKYKKHFATGALALSLLVGSNVYAVSPQDLGIKNFERIYHRHSKNQKNFKVRNRGNIVGTISAISGDSFTLEVKNKKTNTTSSLDVKTDESTKFIKNGNKATRSDLEIGQKVIVIGQVDKTTNIVQAKKVRIASLLHS